MSLNVKQIEEYMLALVANSKELIRESDLLFKKKAYARSYTLSHISREEIAKCQILYAAGRRIISGADVDWKLTMKRLRDHKSKLKQEVVSNSVLSLFIGDELTFNDGINSIKASSDLRNDYKNHSLYVGISDKGEVALPNSVIDKDRAQRNLELARFALNSEINFQNKVGKLSIMDKEKIPDISLLDSMTKEQCIDLLKTM